MRRNESSPVLEILSNGYGLFLKLKKKNNIHILNLSIHSIKALKLVWLNYVTSSSGRCFLSSVTAKVHNAISALFWKDFEPTRNVRQNVYKMWLDYLV